MLPQLCVMMGYN